MICIKLHKKFKIKIKILTSGILRFIEKPLQKPMFFQRKSQYTCKNCLFVYAHDCTI